MSFKERFDLTPRSLLRLSDEHIRLAEQAIADNKVGLWTSQGDSRDAAARVSSR